MSERRDATLVPVLTSQLRNNNLSFNMVKTSAQPQEHNYTSIMQRTACHAGQQQQPGLAQGGRLRETDGAKCC